jgi:hypothetical protein
MAKDGEEMLTKEQQMYNKDLENRKKEIIQLVNEGYIKNILLLNIITGGLFTDEEVGTETENDSLFTEQFNYDYGKDTSMLDILDNIIIHAKEKKCQKDKSCTISFKKYRNKKRSPNKSNVHQKKKSLKKSSTKKSLSKTKKSLKKSKKVAKSLKKKTSQKKSKKM